MISLRNELATRLRQALERIEVDGDAAVRPSTDERFGDYQSNCAMVLAKKLGRKPRELAAQIVDALEIADLGEAPEIAGPGFINFRLKPEFLATRLAAIPAADAPDAERLGIDRAGRPDIVAVDLSSPNLAKEMHVGHLRSTVIGDCVARILEFQGHTVIRENHVGDWGTQFGMLVAYLRRTRPDVLENPDALEIGDLEAFYVEAKNMFDDDLAFKKESQETVVALQQGDEQTRRVWMAFCKESLRHCHRIYDRLDVTLIDRGESFYADLMPVVVERLVDAGLASENDGTLVVPLEGFTTRDGEPLPLIIRKRDGGYNYATSDLATILHRVETLKTDRIVYVIGISQKQHLDMVFATGRAAGWLDGVRVEHLGFGNMLAASGKPFKTREGGTFKLKDLLDQAVAGARTVLEKRLRQERESREDPAEDAELSARQMDEIAETVGIAAVKYFDLSHSLPSDYKFDLDTMVSLEGDTAPYLLYAYTRLRSIGRKAGVEFDALPACPIVLEHPSEIGLAKKLLQFGELIEELGDDLNPNRLTEYLYTLSRAVSRFYDKSSGVRVIDASPDELRNSRLRLSELTARTLKAGLSLLGIKTLERM